MRSKFLNRFLMLAVLSTASIAISQPREFDLGPDGKPVQVGGPTEDVGQGIRKPQSTGTGADKDIRTASTEAKSTFPRTDVLAALSLIFGALSFLFTLYLNRRSERSGVLAFGAISGLLLLLCTYWLT